VLSSTLGLTLAEGRAIPPDVQVAVGPGAVVETVNSAIAIWRRTGNQLLAPVAETLGSFTSTANADRRNDNVTDARVVYDASSDRWFLVTFDVERQETNLAFSASGDPAGSWFIYSFSSLGCPDQPRLAVTRQLVVISTDLFSSCSGGGLIGGQVTVLSKQAVFAGNVTAQDARSYGPDGRYTAITPVQTVTPLEGEYMVSVPTGSASVAYLYTVSSPSAASIPVDTIPIRPLSDPPPAVQAGGVAALHTGDDRIVSALYDNGTIWFSASDGCQLSGQSGVWGCMRLEAISPATKHVVEEQETGLADQKHAFYPAIASDNAGNVIAVFGFTSSSDYPGLGAVTKLSNAQGFSTWTVVSPGLGPYQRLDGVARNRWGDYFSAVRDPAAASVVWVAGEYATVGNAWATRIAAVSAQAQPTAQLAPSVSYNAPSAIGVDSSGATLTANVNAQGAATTYSFEYGTTAGYGAATPPTSLVASSSVQQASYRLTGLSPATTYHFRLKATNAGGTAYGIDQSFTTTAAAPPPPPPPPAAPLDADPPVVFANDSDGRSGKTARLYFSADDDSGQVRIVDEIVQRGRVVGRVRSGFRPASGLIVSVSWKAPRALHGKLAHCVRAWDRAGNASARSCAALTLQGGRR
jgi:hypothetical protein